MSRKIIAILSSLLCATTAWANPIDMTISVGSDDGVEVDHRFWEADTSPLVVGRVGDGDVRQVGLRFSATCLKSSRQAIFARLRFSARGGSVADSLALNISGVLEAEGLPLSQDRRPSQLPRTTAESRLVYREEWEDGGGNQLFYYTEDISEIVNEIVSQPDWGVDGDGLILCVEDESAQRFVTNYLAFSDLLPGRWPATLQVCRDLNETFLAHEIVGRPTDSSATVNFLSLVSLEAYVEYGPGNLAMSTPPQVVPANEAADIDLTGLPSDTLCNYRLCYRLAGSNDEFETGYTRQFRTQRGPGEPFVFTVQADSHIWESWAAANPEGDNLKLYVRVIDNATADNPDFHFSMGDYSMTEYSQTAQHARDRFEVQRPFLDRMIHSVPFYLVLGNHEGELGYFHVQGDPIPGWAEQARLAFVPNPYPDGFYSGCPEPSTDGQGLRESYFSWEWGDALFVVLDPYWYTLERPFHNEHFHEGGGWAWTLGLEQYNWLHQVVNESEKPWKIILLHHLVGGIDHGNSAYGRGGIEAVKWHVSHNATFEWGGQDHMGMNTFSLRRPEFEHGPIHDLLVNAGVSVVVTGHDHFYSRQELDGLQYLTVPQPQDSFYEYGAMEEGEYIEGTLLPNSGHVRFQVSTGQLQMDYVRAFLPGEGQNGMVADTYTMTNELSPALAPAAPETRLSISPNPTSASTFIRPVGDFAKADGNWGQVKIHDVAGRLVKVLKADSHGVFVWNRQSSAARPVASGVYFATWENGVEKITGRVVVVR